MLTCAFLLLAASLWCWPDARAKSRLAVTATPRALRSPSWLVGAGAISLVLSVGGVAAGIGGLLAASSLAALAVWYARFRRTSRTRLALVAGLAAGLRLLVAELRAGAHPAAAAEGVATDAPAEVADVFRRFGTAARLGGDIRSAIPDVDALRQPLARMTRAWILAERHGVALADLLDSVRRDIEHRVAFARITEARMAGPRATAGVLAALPGLGLVLGEVSGSAPLAVLTGRPFGQLLLVAGVLLLCIGVLWTVRLTEAVVRV